jgi:hypothetical protein
LFWNKKNRKSGKDPLGLDYDDDRRQFYRVEPATDKPVVFCHGNHTEPVTNLGAGGLAFFSTSKFQSGQQIEGKLYLPDLSSPLPLLAEVVNVEVTSLVRMNISKIHSDHRELIHQYVLDRQKEILGDKDQPEPEP